MLLIHNASCDTTHLLTTSQLACVSLGTCRSLSVDIEIMSAFPSHDALKRWRVVWERKKKYMRYDTSETDMNLQLCLPVLVRLQSYLDLSL
jgi:hypothetical protein